MRSEREEMTPHEVGLINGLSSSTLNGCQVCSTNQLSWTSPLLLFWSNSTQTKLLLWKTKLLLWKMLKVNTNVCDYSKKKCNWCHAYNIINKF